MDTRKPHILMIGGWDEALEKAARVEARLTLFQNKDLLTMLQSRLAGRVVTTNFRECGEALLLAEAIHRVDPFDGVVSFTEFGLETAAAIQKALGIKGNPPAPVRLTRDKVAMREHLNAAGLDPLAFKRCGSFEEAKSFLADCAGPIICKPGHGSGSEGVSIVRTEGDLRSAWLLASKALAQREPVICEEYIDGPEYSVESLSLGGEHSIVAITEKMTTHDGHFIELGHNIPAPLSEDIKRRVEAFVLSFLDEIGQECGPCHTEIRIAKSGPRIIESQTRVGGDRIWEMVELALGVDLITATLEYLAFGRIPVPGIAGKKAASIRFFMNEENSISRVGGLEKAREMLGVVRVTYDAGKKDSLGGRSNDSRQGYVLATGGDVSESASRAALAYQTVSSS